MDKGNNVKEIMRMCHMWADEFKPQLFGEEGNVMDSEGTVTEGVEGDSNDIPQVFLDLGANQMGFLTFRDAMSQTKNSEEAYNVITNKARMLYDTSCKFKEQSKVVEGLRRSFKDKKLM